MLDDFGEDERVKGIVLEWQISCISPEVNGRGGVDIDPNRPHLQVLRAEVEDAPRTRGPPLGMEGAGGGSISPPPPPLFSSLEPRLRTRPGLAASRSSHSVRKSRAP